MKRNLLMKLNVLLCLIMVFVGMQGAHKVSSYDASINIEQYKQYLPYRPPYGKHCTRAMMLQAWRTALFHELDFYQKEVESFKEQCQSYHKDSNNIPEDLRLYVAIEHGDVETCKSIVQTDPKLVNKPLYIEVNEGFDMPLTPLFMVITCGLLSGTCKKIEDYESILELFIQNKINLTTDASHQDPLLLAYQFGTWKMVIMLLRAGVTLGDSISLLSGGNQVLRQAICERDLDLLKIVLDAGVHVDMMHRYDPKYYSMPLTYLINQYLCHPDHKILTLACAKELPLIEELLVRDANTQDLYTDKERTYTIQKLSEKFPAIRTVVKSAAVTRDARADESAAQMQKVLTELYLISDLAKLCADYIWRQEKKQIQ